MTVKELIEKLEKCNLNAEVYCKYESDGIDLNCISIITNSVLEIRNDGKYSVVLNMC